MSTKLMITKWAKNKINTKNLNFLKIIWIVQLATTNLKILGKVSKTLRYHTMVRQWHLETLSRDPWSALWIKPENYPLKISLYTPYVVTLPSPHVWGFVTQLSHGLVNPSLFVVDNSRFWTQVHCWPALNCIEQHCTKLY